MLNYLIDFIFNQLLDDLWADVTEARYVRTAAVVGFNLAFVIRLNPDDEPTLASKPRRKRK